MAFVGKSFADVSASVALSFMTSVLDNLRKLKWITPSSTAPSGYKDAQVSIAAPAMLCSVSICVSTGIYFIPIKFRVFENPQTAST